MASIKPSLNSKSAIATGMKVYATVPRGSYLLGAQLELMKWMKTWIFDKCESEYLNTAKLNTVKLNTA